MQKYLVVVGLSLIPFLMYAQVDSLKNTTQLDELEVTATKLNKYYVDSLQVYLSRKEIEALQATDLGELLKKLPGINLNSYGGLGGLKSVSIRGLSSKHTSFVVDGFNQTHTQNGQVNLGLIQLDNVESVIVSRGGASELNIPVASQLSGNNIILNTFQATAPTIPLQHKFFTKFGSFGLVDYHYIGKTGSKKLYGGVQFKYRHAHGAYPFKYMNYQTEMSGIRKNNDYTDINGGFNLAYRPTKNHQIIARLQYRATDQGVPGAIVLYNDFAKQRLKTSNFQFKADYRGKLKNINYRFHIMGMSDSLLYKDPNYLNEAGELVASYKNKVTDIGLTGSLPIGKLFKINVGLQETVSKLNSVESLNSRPERFHFQSFAKGRLTLGKWSLIGQLGYQYVDEKNKNGSASNSIYRFNPYGEIQFRAHQKLTFIAYYRNSFRMPTFNELYYNNIGNTDLKPEDANQLALTSSWSIFDKDKFYFGLQASAYYHQINNLILAIPTKNLFVWSISNVGKNEIYGSDVILSLSWNFTKNWTTQLTANYTYQQSLDKSNKNNATYNNLIAYSPEHAANADLTLKYKNLGVRASTFHISKRYTLNQNIQANELNGFSTYDLTIFNRFNIGKNNHVKLQFTMKNITDESYAYVKSFIMPGRHYLFTFLYEFI